MSDDDQTPGPRVRRLSGPVLAVELLLLLLAALAFGLLADVRLNSGDPVVGISETFDDDVGLVVLLGTLGLALLIAILLLLLKPRAREAPVAAPAQTEELLEFDTDEQVIPPAEEPEGPLQEMTLGCRGCGTVFHHLGHPGSAFACPNCSRPGVVANRQPVVTDLHNESCPHCAATFQRYMRHAECPSCHKSLDI